MLDTALAEDAHPWVVSCPRATVVVSIPRPAATATDLANDPGPAPLGALKYPRRFAATPTRTPVAVAVAVHPVAVAGPVTDPGPGPETIPGFGGRRNMDQRWGG
jgi:hypothetical protein